MKNIIPPKAPKKPTHLVEHEHTRTDNYYWMNNRENPEVINYLKEENTYCDEVLAPTANLQKQLFTEIKKRIKEDDSSVPYLYNDYWYLIKYEKGNEYPTYLRYYLTTDAAEELILDANTLAASHTYFDMGTVKVSENNKLVLFSTDTIGRRNYTLQIKDLLTNQMLPDTIENTTGSAIWFNDNQSFLYLKKDPTTLRSFQVWKHKIGETNDQLIFQEDNALFDISISKSKSRQYIFIHISSATCDEILYIDSNKPDDKLTLFQSRIEGIEYDIDHHKKHFYIYTNYGEAENFCIMKTPITHTTVDNWEIVIAHNQTIFIENFELFDQFLVVEQRFEGLIQLRILSWQQNIDYFINFPEETYTASIGLNLDFTATFLRYSYTSLTSPSTIYDFEMFTKEQRIVKKQEIPDENFIESDYIAERQWATATDGKKIALSIVRHKNTQYTSETPLLLYAYGSYGYTIDPYFSISRISLLDRGFVFAIAHIRGGQYLGRKWYEEGKYLQKKNTFTDYIACAQFLQEKNYTSANHLYGMGGSAGGLLMGAVCNMRPDLFKAIVAQVPFVDVVTTMLDESIPLTTGEFEEWGNPKDKTYYDYMLSYSPYDNIIPQKYPNILVTSGLHDSQVQYWEPTKWVAKLRDFKTDTNQLLLKTNMDAGHGGASGRYEEIKETALEYAFLLQFENTSFN